MSTSPPKMARVVGAGPLLVHKIGTLGGCVRAHLRQRVRQCAAVLGSGERPGGCARGLPSEAGVGALRPRALVAPSGLRLYEQPVHTQRLAGEGRAEVT